MRCKTGSVVLLTLTDGAAVRGRVVRSWRWRVMKLVDAEAVTPQGVAPIAGHVFVPHRSVLVGQVSG